MMQFFHLLFVGFLTCVFLFFLGIKNNQVECFSTGGKNEKSQEISRRDMLLKTSMTITTGTIFSNDILQSKAVDSGKADDSSFRMINGGGKMFKMIDPNTYAALCYMPPTSLQVADASNNNSKAEKILPLLVVLHGAAKNELDIWDDLGNINGEHGGLIPSLLLSGRAPSILTDNFIVVAPYSKDKRSFYEDSRSQLLQFISWSINRVNEDPSLQYKIDPKRIFLFGFSDGATVSVELLTTGKFKGGVITSYGFTGFPLPGLAQERLRNIPIWVFHSQDDVIFDVKQTSDKLVDTLRKVNSVSGSENIIRYTRYKIDPEGYPTSVRGHTTGITASKTPELYEWMLSI